MRADGLEQLHEDLGAARHDVARLEIVFLAGEVADQATGLDHQQATRRDIPGVEPDLEEAIGAAGRQPGQVERRGAGTAQAGGLLHQVAEHTGIGVQMGEVAVWEAGAYERILQFVAFAHTDAAIIEEGATAAAGGIEVVADGIVDDRLIELVAMQQGDRHAELGKIVQEIGGAIERIDHPAVFRIGRRAGSTRLLG